MEELIKENSEESNKKLIECCTNYYELTNHGENLLHLASRYNNETIINYAINKIHVNLDNYRGTTPLYYAMISNSTNVVKILLQNHANPRIRSGFSGMFPSDATQNQEIKTMLLKYEADVIPLDRNLKLKPNFSRYVSYKYRLYMWWLSNLNKFGGTIVEGVDIIPEAKIIFETNGIEGLSNKCQELLMSFINGNDDCCLYCSSKVNLKSCSKCKEIRFCNVECQRNAFKIHKYDC